MYDAVTEDLSIDPEKIAARPAWSLEVARKVRKHQRKTQRSAAATRRSRPTRTKKAASQPAASTRARTKRAAAK
jgi:hypothetical protein